MQRIDWVFYSACLLAGPIDVGMTLPNWHLEGNPIVIALGPIAFIAVKALALGFVIYLWRTFEIQDYKTAKACAWFLFGLYSIVIVTNHYVLV